MIRQQVDYFFFQAEDGIRVCLLSRGLGMCIRDRNKEAVAAELISMGTARITDIIDLHTGQVKALEDIPEEALAAIKKVTAGPQGVTIELFDKVSVLRVLAKASGMLDVEKNVDKPSIIGINMKGPDITTTYEAEDE